jgi:hypothetical protein
LNGVEYLMELLPIPLIASVHGLQPVLPHLAGEFESIPSGYVSRIGYVFALPVEPF